MQKWTRRDRGVYLWIHLRSALEWLDLEFGVRLDRIRWVVLPRPRMFGGDRERSIHLFFRLVEDWIGIRRASLTKDQIRELFRYRNWSVLITQSQPIYSSRSIREWLPRQMPECENCAELRVFVSLGECLPGNDIFRSALLQMINKRQFFPWWERRVRCLAKMWIWSSYQKQSERVSWTSDGLN